MGIIKRQGIKGTIILYVGVLVGYINTLFLLPYCLELDQIGLLRALIDCALLFVPFAQLGVSSIALRFFPFYSDKDNKHHHFLSLLLLISLTGCLMFAVMFFVFRQNIEQYFSQKSYLFGEYIYWLLPLILTLTFFNVFLFYCRALFRIVIPSLIQDVFIRVGLSLIVVVFWFKWFDFDALIFAYVMLYAMSLVLIVLYVKKLGHFFIGMPIKKDYGKKIKEMISYGVITLFTSTGSIVVFRLDVMMITVLLGLKYSGVYAIVIALSSMMEIPSRALMQISAPVVANSLSKNDHELTESIYKKTSINNLIISALLYLLVVVNIHDLFSLIPNAQRFELGIIPFYYVGLAKILDLSTGVASSIINFSKHFVYNLVIVAFLWIGGYFTNYMLVDDYQLEGIAMGSAIVFFLVMVVRVMIIYLKFGILPFSINTIKFLLISLIAYGIIHFGLPQINNVYISIVIKSLLLTLVYGGLIYITSTSKDLNDLIKSVFKRFLNSH